MLTRVKSKLKNKAKEAWRKDLGLPADFPLSRRKGENRWVRKIGGKFFCFTGTTDEALVEGERTKVAHMPGRTPPTKDDAAALVADAPSCFSQRM